MTARGTSCRHTTSGLLVVILALCLAGGCGGSAPPPNSSHGEATTAPPVAVNLHEGLPSSIDLARLQVVKAPIGDRFVGLSTACAPTPFCFSYEYDDTSKRAFEFDGTAWTASNSLDTASIGDQVACPVAGQCIAITVGGFSLLSHGVWGPVQAVPAWHSGDNYLISCKSFDACVAVDADTAQINTLIGDKWVVAPSSQILDPFGGPHIVSLSCATADACVALAVTSSTASAQTGPPALFGLTWSGTSWTRQLIGNSIYDEPDVDCGSPTFCVAADQAGYSIWNGHSWSPFVSSPGEAGSVDATPDQAFVGCISATQCILLGQTTTTYVTSAGASSPGPNPPGAADTFNCGDGYCEQVDAPDTWLWTVGPSTGGGSESGWTLTYEGDKSGSLQYVHITLGSDGAFALQSPTVTIYSDPAGTSYFCERLQGSLHCSHSFSNSDRAIVDLFTDPLGSEQFGGLLKQKRTLPDRTVAGILSSCVTGEIEGSATTICVAKAAGFVTVEDEPNDTTTLVSASPDLNAAALDPPETVTTAPPL